MRKIITCATLALLGLGAQAEPPVENGRSHGWKKHTVYEGQQALTAVAGDFTGDGQVDVITDSAGKTRLLVAPDWQEVILDDRGDNRGYIHSATFDVDDDGDLDYIAAHYNPGRIVWLEQPADGQSGRWNKRRVDDQIHGIHGLITGDVDGDGKLDLLATSAQPKDPFPESLAWYRVPSQPHQAERWQRSIFADQDAPGLTHYIGVGDIDGDGKLDAATGAKGGPQATSPGDWFAWWKAGDHPDQPWAKKMISDREPGATNIHPAHVDGDGKMDFVASRGHGRGVVWFKAPQWQRFDIDSDIKEPHCLVAADIDDDGDVDAATCAYGDKVAAWYENDGTGTFTKHVVGEQQEAYDIRAVDMDGDQDQDLLIGGRGSNNVVWYENPAR